MLEYSYTGLFNDKSAWQHKWLKLQKGINKRAIENIYNIIIQAR